MRALLKSFVGPTILALAFQVPPPPVATLPELKLNAPSPIRLNRMVTFSIDPIVAPDNANYKINDISVDWVVCEKTKNVDPLENYLQIDRLDGSEAYMPTGPNPTSVYVHVTATLNVTSTDGKSSFKKLRYGKLYDFGNPIVDPVVPDPGPKPQPTPVTDPTLPDGKYKLAAWAYKTLKESQAGSITKAEAQVIANGCRQVAQMTRNQPASTPQQVVTMVADANRNNAGSNLQNWITAFFEPVRQKLNSLNRLTNTTAEQATTYEELANGLEAWAKQ